MNEISPARSAGRAASINNPPVPDSTYDAFELSDFWLGVFDILGQMHDGKAVFKARHKTLTSLINFLETHDLVMDKVRRKYIFQFHSLHFSEVETARLEVILQVVF